MKQLFSLIVLGLVATVSSAQAFTLYSEYGAISVHPSDVCYRSGTFQLKSGTTEICVDGNYKHDCAKVSVAPTLSEVATKCVAYRTPKGSSPICTKWVEKTISRDVEVVAWASDRGAKNAYLTKSIVTIADCE
jgi:hypothetical protein